MGRATEFKRIRKNTADNERNHPHHSDTTFTPRVRRMTLKRRRQLADRIRIASDCSRGGFIGIPIGQRSTTPSRSGTV